MVTGESSSGRITPLPGSYEQSRSPEQKRTSTANRQQEGPPGPGSGHPAVVSDSGENSVAENREVSRVG